MRPLRYTGADTAEAWVVHLRRKQTSAGRPVWWIPSMHHKETVETVKQKIAMVNKKQLTMLKRATMQYQLR